MTATAREWEESKLPTLPMPPGDAIEAVARAVAEFHHRGARNVDGQLITWEHMTAHDRRYLLFAARVYLAPIADRIGPAPTPADAGGAAVTSFTEVRRMLDESRHVAGLYELAADAMQALLAEREAMVAELADLRRQVDDFDDLQRFNSRAAEDKVRKAWAGADEAIAEERARMDRYARIGNRVSALARQGRKSVRLDEVMGP